MTDKKTELASEEKICGSECYKMLSSGTEEIIQTDQLSNKLSSHTPLTIKLGFDPTAPDIHLGHSVVLRKIRQFQTLGHRIRIIIGDFTGMIGDPTGKSQIRKRLSPEEVAENAETYKKQIFKIIDPGKTEILLNSEWLSPKRFTDVLELLSHYTVARLLERDDFSKRFQNNQPISMIEMMYPLIQGYDSVVLKADIEIGGTDQKFNMLVGRELMRTYGMEPQVIITMPILEGLDGGQKMSKSLKNYVGICDSPSEMFGKIMSIPDTLIIRYFSLLTDCSPEEISSMQNDLTKGINPRDIKIRLAQTIVRQYHTAAEAEAAAHDFFTVFSQKGIPENISEITISPEPIWIVDLIARTGYLNSNNEIRRQIKAGAVKLDSRPVFDDTQTVSPHTGQIIKIGKRGFFKIKTG